MGEGGAPFAPSRPASSSFHVSHQVEIASIIIDFFASGAPVVAEGVEMHK
jgi:hypothetical protein